MGWFDQETKGGDGASPVAPSAPDATPPRANSSGSTSASGGSSTVGKLVQINGTVESDEDLEIGGKVEGTINARKGLRIARDANVKAVINGAEILVEGTVTGDINASETLVLGATAALTGNIKTPSLQIREGAFFRGQVTMQQPGQQETKPLQPKAPVGSEAKSPVVVAKGANGATDAAGNPSKGNGPSSASTSGDAASSSNPQAGNSKHAGVTGG